MSRWTIPALCAWPRPSSTCATIEDFSASESVGVLPQPRVEVLPPQQLHHDVGRAVGVVAEVEDRHHGGVAEPCDRPGLALEALLVLRIARRLGQHHLERDLALQHRIEGPIDGAHAAAAEELDDLVLSDPGAVRDVRQPGGGGASGGAGRVRLLRRCQRTRSVAPSSATARSCVVPPMATRALAPPMRSIYNSHAAREIAASRCGDCPGNPGPSARLTECRDFGHSLAVFSTPPRREARRAAGPGAIGLVAGGGARLTRRGRDDPRRGSPPRLRA